MPIPYDKLTYNDILHHQAAYECFDKAGKELFPDWDIIGFEKAVLGCGDNHYLFMAEQIKKFLIFLEIWMKLCLFSGFEKKGSITVMSYSFLLQSIGVAEVRHYGGHMQHANSPMTNYLWTNSFSMKNIRVLSKSLV